MDWQNLLKNIAPALSTALAGPLAGIAVKTIGDALNIPAATQDNIKGALTGGITPEQALSIKNADADFMLKMNQLGFEHAEAIAQFNVQTQSIEVQDKISARLMQTNLQSHIVSIMALLITSGFFAILFYLLFCQVPPENKDLLGNVLESLKTVWIMIASFYFGTSFGSQSKDSLLARIRRDSR